MRNRRNEPYDPGELEVILSLAPTAQNIKWLSTLLGRTEKAIEIVYKLAYGHGPFGKNADVQQGKILAAKKRVGIRLGRAKQRSQDN